MTIENRLKEERERLGFTQPQFGAIGGTTKKSQIDYEKGSTQPRASYFFEISKVGADVQYIITGVRSTQALSTDEQLLIAAYREASPTVKLYMLQGAQQATGTIDVKGDGQVAIGNKNIQIGGKIKRGKNDTKS